MRATAVLARLCVLAALILGSCDQGATQGASGPSQRETVSPRPSALDSGRASPSPSPAPIGAVDLKTTPVSVPVDFRYVEAWPGRIVLLDLVRRIATEVATYTARSEEPGYPGAQMSSSDDGRTLLVLVHVGPLESTLFMLSPETGQAKVLLRGAVDRTVISASGVRFAVARHDADRAFTGLWAGTLADGTMHRLIADDPQLVGAPPVPFAFSPGGDRIAFGLGMGETGYRAGVIAVGSAEVDAARLRDPSMTTPGVSLLDAAAGAEFLSATELFVWSSRSLFSGQTLTYTYDLAAQKKTELYRPTGDVRLDAAWRPHTEQFVTIEQPMCCGVGLPRTPWVRGRDGTARMLDSNSFIAETWWSRDGSRLYATTGGDDSTGGVSDLLTAQAVMQFCKRGGVVPGACT